jgi:prevent-host-death family protein
MTRSSKTPSTVERVGAAEFRTNLAKYLKLARSGRQVIIQQWGRNAFVLTRLEEGAPTTVFGCMRDRTQCAEDAVVGARETWPAGELP